MRIYLYSAVFIRDFGMWFSETGAYASLCVSKRVPPRSFLMQAGRFVNETGFTKSFMPEADPAISFVPALF
jgi:hypothetical protein